MSELGPIGKLLVVAGLSLAGLGALLWLISSVAPGLRLGRLPGDIHIERDGFSFYFPITTMILLSVVVSLGIALVRWLTK
jgi:hypothetical protein